jgi:hypothetical protein
MAAVRASVGACDVSVAGGLAARETFLKFCMPRLIRGLQCQTAIELA